MSSSENLWGGDGGRRGGRVRMLRRILTNVCNNRAGSGSTFFILCETRMSF